MKLSKLSFMSINDNVASRVYWGCNSALTAGLPTGKTLTVGRKAAPASYREAQSQLFALGEAIKSIYVEDGDAALPEDSSRLQAMVENCEPALQRFRALLEKYTSIGQGLDGSDLSRSRRWRGEVRENWKKVRWTMKEDDVEKLRKDLIIHIQSLTLTINASTSARAKIIESKVDGVHGMLTDIHKWYTDNLKVDNFPPRPPGERLGVSSHGRSLEPAFTFELYAESSTELQPIPLFRMASFAPGWLNSKPSLPAQRLFLCRCSSMNPLARQLGMEASEIHSEQLKFSFLTISLIIRLAGAGAWQLFGTSSSSITPLLIKGVNPTDLSSFQECIDQLTLLQAQRAVEKSLSSMLVHYSPTDTGERVLSVLDMKVETTNFHGKIRAVTFTTQGQHFIQHSIDSVQILHYRSMSRDDPVSAISSRPTMLHQKYAEVIFRPISSGSGESRFVINVYHNTRIEQDPDTSMLRICEVICANEEGSSEPVRIACEVVAVDFLGDEAVHEFLSSLKAIQNELHVHFLESQRFGEHLIYQRSCGDIILQDRYLVDAEAKLLFDPRSSQYRMTIASRPKNASISIDLPPEFFDTLQPSNREDLGNPNLTSHIVEHHEDSTMTVEQGTDISLMTLRQIETSEVVLRLC